MTSSTCKVYKIFIYFLYIIILSICKNIHKYFHSFRGVHKIIIIIKYDHIINKIHFRFTKIIENIIQRK